MSDCIITRRGGGGSKVKVISVENAENLPLTASENTIAIISDTAISSYVFDKEKPETPANGMVWFATNIPTNVSMNLAKDGTITLYVGQGMQYIDGAWVSVDTYVFQNSAWVEVSGFVAVLYEAGVFAEGIPYGTYETVPDKTTITFNDSNIKLTCVNTSTARRAYVWFGPVYLDGNAYIEAEMKSTISGSGTVYLDVYVADAPNTPYENAVASNLYSVSGSKTTVVTLDVSALEGMYYLHVGTHTSAEAERSATIISVKQMLFA